MEKGTIKKGFKAFRNNVKDDNRKLQSLRNCKSCKYLYKDDDVATEEVCHNNSVTSYDMVDDGNIKYCTFWTPVWHKD
jgi:hypothetical protein